MGERGSLTGSILSVKYKAAERKVVGKAYGKFEKN